MQEPQLGTGTRDAGAPHLDERWPTLVLYGDVPLIRAETLKQLVHAAGKGLGLLTATLDRPTGYGRILRNGKKVVELSKKGRHSRQRPPRDQHRNRRGTDEELKSWLAKLQNKNAQKEYYLTDIVALATKERVSVTAIQADAAWEALGVNSRVQLAELERIYQRKLAASLLEHGVALADPSRCDVRGSLACGRDVAVDVNCVFEGEVKLGDGVSVGANCVLKGVTVGAGTRIEPFCTSRTPTSARTAASALRSHPSGHAHAPRRGCAHRNFVRSRRVA